MSNDSNSITQVRRNSGNATTTLELTAETEDAIAQFRRSLDWQGLVQYVSERAYDLIAGDRHEIVESWLHQVPPEIIPHHSWACYWLGRCRLQTDSAQSRYDFERAFNSFRVERDYEGLFLSWSGIVEAVIDCGDLIALDPWIDKYNKTLANKHTKVTAEAEGRAAINMFRALLCRRPYSLKKSEWLERAILKVQKDGNLSERLCIAMELMHYFLWYNEPAKAMMLVEALKAGLSFDEIEPGERIHWLLVEAKYYLQQGKYENCRKIITKGLDLASDIGIDKWNIEFYLVQICAYLGLNKLDSAEESIAKLNAIVYSQARPWIAHYHGLAAWLALRRNHLSIAAEHGETALTLYIECGMVLYDTFMRIVLVQIHSECNQESQAIKHLSKIQHAAYKLRSGQLKCICKLLQSISDVKHGRHSQARLMLSQAFTASKRHGYEVLLSSQHDILSGLCASALEYEIEVKYVQNLVRRHNLTPEPPPLSIDHWPWPVKVYSMGRFTLLKNGQQIRFARKAQHKPMELLKVLIAYGSREVSEERITSVVWPDAEGDTAHKAFDTTLHRLRKLLGHPEALLLQDGRLTLDDHYCWVDSWALERLLNEIDMMLHARSSNVNSQDVAMLSEKVLSLYQGHFLGHESLQAWTISLRERLRSKFLRHLMDISDYWIKQKRWDNAIRYYKKGLEVDDLAEQFYQQLMICYRHIGRRSEALAVYQRCRTILSIVLGIKPSPMTEDIRKDLMKRS